MRPKNTEKPFFLLSQPEPITDDLFNSLLGLVVEDPSRPLFHRHRPGLPYDLKARDAVDYLYPPGETDCKDIQIMLSKTRSKGARAKLQKVVEATLQLSGSKSVDLKAAGFRRISMRDAPTLIDTLITDTSKAQPEPAKQPTHTMGEKPQSHGLFGAASQQLTRLFEDPKVAEARRIETQIAKRAQYQKLVMELFKHQRDGKLAVVTSFITCTDMTKDVNKTKSSMAKLGAGTGPAAAAYHAPDVKIEAEYSKTSDVGTRGTYEGEYLIACSYIPLYINDKPKGLNIPLGWFNVHISPAGAKKYDKIVPGDREMWRIGDDEMEGDIEAPLGGVSGEGTDDDQGEDELAELAFALLDPNDECKEDGDEDEESEDEDQQT